MDAAAETSFTAHWRDWCRRHGIEPVADNRERAAAMEWFSWGVVHGVRSRDELAAMVEADRCRASPRSRLGPR